MYISDTNNHRIRKVTVSTGIITLIAGTGTSSFSGDNGPATSATLYYPDKITVDSIGTHLLFYLRELFIYLYHLGNVYFADYANRRIRKITVSTGIITTVAGNGGTSYSGDGGLATSATLYYPSGIALDSAGNMYISDTNNERIRKVTASTGIITTYAGTGTSSFSGDGGAATSATLDNPRGLTLDSSGNLYIGDYENNRIRKVTVTTSSPRYQYRYI